MLERGDDMKVSIITDQIDQDLETALQVAKEHGYTYVELHNVFSKSIESCNFKEVEEIQRLLEKYEMKVSCIASTIFFLCPLYEDDKVSLFNEEFKTITGNVEDHLSYLDHACSIAKQLNCSKIRLFPFRFPDNKKPPFGTPQDLQLITENIKKAVIIAEKHDITLVLENCPYSRLPKGMMSIQVIKAINSPNLRLLWDPANAFRAYVQNVPQEYLTTTLQEELEIIYPYIGHIHIKDYRRDSSSDSSFTHTALLDGDIQYEPIFDYLKEKNYNLTLSLEPEVDYENTLKCMDTLKKIINE